VKKERWEGDPTHLLTAAAAVIASTPPMTDPTAYAIQAEASIQSIEFRNEIRCKAAGAY
jgi:hypothetical protein